MWYLFGYIILIGVATFMMKAGLKHIDAYQMNLLMGLGMLLITLPAVWIIHKNFKIPKDGLALGSFIGLAMAVGSILFVLALNKLPAGLTAAVATSYVAVVVILSWIFLKEPMDAIKILGLVLTIAGVTILSFKS